MRFLPANDVQPGMRVHGLQHDSGKPSHKGLTVSAVHHHVPVRNAAEFARPAIGMVWIETKGGNTWVIDCEAKVGVS